MLQSSTTITVAEATVVAVLVLVLALTTLVQFGGRVAYGLRRFDLFEILPSWNFFAPNPGRFDYHLLFRDELPAGVLTAWREIHLLRDRRSFHSLWNPERRLKKCVLDAVAAVQQGGGAGAADIRLSVPYLLLLMFVSAYPRSYPSTRTQFLVMISTPAFPEAEPKVILVSGRHDR